MALKGLEFGGFLLDLSSFLSKILRASSISLGWTPEEEEETQNSTCPFFSICDLLKRQL